MDNPMVQLDPGLFIWTNATLLVQLALLAHRLAHDARVHTRCDVRGLRDLQPRVAAAQVQAALVRRVDTQAAPR